jgi:4-hydroxybutyrate CoA-transferase
MTKDTRWLTADEALANVDDGMSVVFPHLSAEPTALTEALWQRASHLHNVKVYSGMLLSGYKFLSTPAAEHICFNSWFPPGTLLRKTAMDVKLEYLPMTWAQTARFLTEMSFDVALIHVSAAAADGSFSSGLNCTVVKAILKSAKLVIAQVNANMPYTCGNSRIEATEIDILVDATVPLLAYPNRQIDGVDRKIGRSIASLISHGTALSFGVGGIPLAAAEALIAVNSRNHTFINTFTDPVQALIEAGCGQVENPKAFVGDIFGSLDLYRWVANNPAVALASAQTTHSVESLVARGSVVSVNSALEIDLFGQVNGETIEGKQAGGMGGSVDFAVAGQIEGSHFIIGLRSRTNGDKSRIVRRLDSEIVSVSRTFLQTVVTEFGIADLRNKTVNERAVALASIAHPDDRPSLLEQAAKLH